MRSKKGWIAILLIAVLIGGGAYYVRQRRGARRQIQQVIADMSQMTMPVPVVIFPGRLRLLVRFQGLVKLI